MMTMVRVAYDCLFIKVVKFFTENATVTGNRLMVKRNDKEKSQEYATMHV